jgi:hypothetical protein
MYLNQRKELVMIVPLPTQEETLYRVDLSQETRHHEPQEAGPNSRTERLVEDLLVGTKQLLFSFIIPSTFCSTDNIIELQQLVTQGNALLFFV